MTTAVLADRLDRLPLTRLHLAIVALGGIGLFVDTAELSLGSVLSAVFSVPGSPLDTSQLAWLLASVFIGGAIGAPLLGWLSDRHGRRTALQVSMALVALPSFGAALSSDGAWLIVFRFLSGMALGAYPPLMHAYFADILPPRWRAPLDLCAVSLGLLGWPLVALLVWWLTPWQPLDVEGWRWALHAGGVMSLIVGAAFWLVPESPRNLIARGRHVEAERAYGRFERSAGQLPPPTLAEPVLPSTTSPAPQRRGFGSYWPRVLLIATIYLFRPWATVGFPLIVGALMIAKGYTLDRSLLSIGFGGFGAAAGALMAALVVDRINRRLALILVSAGLIATGLAIALNDDYGLLIGAIAAFSFLAAIYGPLLSIYAAEIFPTGIRASATATAWSMNRIGSAIAPLALLPTLQVAGPLLTFTTIAATLVLNLILIALFGPKGRARLPVEE
jgi:putative MFS transporter